MKSAIKTQSITKAAVVAASLFALGCAGVCSSTQAAEPTQFHTTIVSYGDLNLDSDQGAKVLYARLRHAAQNVCSSLEGRDLIQKKSSRSCFDNAVANAVEQVNKTRVTALHNQMVSHTIKG